MAKKLLFPLYLFLLMVLSHSLNYVDAVRWNDEICSGDNMMITFSKCCGNEPYCSSNTNESDCNDGEFGLYCEWVENDDSEDNTGKCAPKLDDRSDVCCRGGAVKDACHSIAYKMECPKDWLVNKGCCPDSAERKYNKVLGGIPEDMDCCNSPCTQVEKAISNGTANCTLSSRCAPGPRSYAMTYDPYNTLGFYHDYRHHGGPHHFGSIIHGSGYGDHYGYGKDHHGYEDDHDYDDEHEYDSHDHDDKHGKKDHIDEITVDDLFELMIEALEDDTDVKSYDAEYYTDSYLGKTRSGGLLASLNLPDPDYYFDLVYGNPWGHTYNLEHEFKNPTPIYGSYGYDSNNPSPYVYDNHPSSYGRYDHPANYGSPYANFESPYAINPYYTISYFGAFDPYFNQIGDPQPAYNNQAQQYGNSPGGYGGALDNGYTSYPQTYQQPLQEQYGNSPQPTYHNQAQQYGSSPGGYGGALNNGYTSYPQTYQQPLQENQYGNSPQPAYNDKAQHYVNAPQPTYNDKAQQYGNAPQPTYHNQQPAASSVYGGVNQYSSQPKPQYQQSYQQPPIAKPAVNDHAVKYKYSPPAARRI